MKIPFWKLALAYFIDWIVISIIAAIINFPIGLVLGASGAEPAAIMVVITFFSLIISVTVFVLYFALLEYFLHASLGKLAMKIVVTPKAQ
jgi:hypothetical protein